MEWLLIPPGVIVIFIAIIASVYMEDWMKGRNFPKFLCWFMSNYVGWMIIIMFMCAINPALNREDYSKPIKMEIVYRDSVTGIENIP